MGAKTPFSGLSALLVDLYEKNVINSAELDLADLLVYEQAPVLCSAYSLLDPEDPETLNDLIETLLLVLDRVLDIKFDRYCRQAKNCIAILVEELEIDELSVGFA